MPHAASAAPAATTTRTLNAEEAAVARQAVAAYLAHSARDDTPWDALRRQLAQSISVELERPKSTGLDMSFGSGRALAWILKQWARAVEGEERAASACAMRLSSSLLSGESRAD